jgi:hypothetical protein
MAAPARGAGPHEHYSSHGGRGEPPGTAVTLMAMALMDDGWEARMALRAAARRIRAEVEQEIRDAIAENETRAALAEIDPDVYHGWPLSPDRRSVTIGNGMFCAGCGTIMGCFTISLYGTEPRVETRPDPDWPFTRENCPMRKSNRFVHG